MSSISVLVTFFLAIVLLIFMVSKLKIHAALSMLVVVIALAVAIGTPIGEVIKNVNVGFGNTAKSVCLIIFLGSFLGVILGKTGAATRITEFFLKVFGKKNSLWAVGASCLLLGIPVFPDTISLLLVPICTNLAASTGISMSAYVATMNVVITSSSLVPPTPGPVAAAVLLGLPLGVVIPWGCLVCIPGLIATVLFAKTRTKQIPLNEEFLGKDVKPENMPSTFSSLLPILLPVILIVADSVISVALPKSTLNAVFDFIGAPTMALLLGCFLAVGLQVKEGWKNVDVRGKWVDTALVGGASPIFITCLGGSLAFFIKSSGAAVTIAKGVIGVGVPGILIPMLLAALIRIITGSNTLGVITAAALCEPMLNQLGISALAAFLAIGSGGIMFSHANSSGLWLCSSLAKMDFNEALKSIGGSTFVSSLACCVTTIILFYAGLI